MGFLAGILKNAMKAKVSSNNSLLLRWKISVTVTLLLLFKTYRCTVIRFSNFVTHFQQCSDFI